MQNDLIGLMVRDPHDSHLPELGLQVMIRDPQDVNEQLLIDLRQYAEAFAEEAEAEERYVRSIFDKAKASFLKIETNQEPFDLLAHYFKNGRTS